ncbi:MAG TPA: Hsp20/alpha crystallin family protein [Nevskiales bacterium]|nr:Hsp20/alpha crystallin family protein [Nevskiales bacterium]
MKLETLKESVSSFWDNVTEGWRHLMQSASGALTRFKPSENTNLPSSDEVDDESYLPTRRWAMLGGDVFEDERRLVVRLELPGMAKEDIAIEVCDDALVVSGEKRFARESTAGRWRVMQCAYGHFRRVVPLPAPVNAEGGSATYKNGVLRIELPKRTPGEIKVRTIEVS